MAEKIVPSALPQHLRQLRSNIRNFLLTANLAELKREQQIHQDAKDEWGVKFIQELIDEIER